MTRVACIDIGTVTCRLALADVEGGRVVRLRKTSTICDLGEGLQASGRISVAARDRVLACVRGYVVAAHEAHVRGACCTLTSAARDASNARELTDGLAELGLRPEVIAGDVEGRLTFAGVAGDYVGAPIVVADNGGGSTEVAAGTLCADGTVDLGFVRSVDVGCRRVTELFLSAEGPDGEASVTAARAFAYEALAPAVSAALGAVPDARTLVTCGGTVTSLVAMREALVPYDADAVHGAVLSADDLAAQVSALAALPVAERARIVGLQPKRAGVILGGAVVVGALLDAMREVAGISQLVVSEHDLLYGLAIAAAAAATADAAVTPGTWVPTLAAV